MGRWSYSSRRVVERSSRITIQNLTDWHLLKRGPLAASWEGGISETRGAWMTEIARVNYRVNIDSTTPPVVGKIVLETTSANRSASCSTHLIEAQAVHYGGFRYFFRCTHCGRLVKALYLGNFDRWACRTCCGLVYESSRRHRDPYALQGAGAECRKKAAYLRTHGHPRLASRMEARAKELEAIYEAAWTAAAGRFISRVKARHPGF